jgi:CDP-glycerol glycerophosphotransferase
MNIITKFLKYLIILISVFIPIKKGRYVFASCSENLPNELFWYIENLVDYKNSDFIWLGFMNQNSKRITNIEKNNLRAYLYSLTAEKVFFTHSLDDLNNFYNFKSKRINLWHGCPIKKIGNDSLIFSSKRGFFNRYFRPEKFLWSTFFAGTEAWEPIFRSAYGFEKEQINLGGLPRSAYLRSFNGKKANLTSDKLISFMPTYRNGITNYKSYDLILKSKVLQSFLSEKKLKLLVKLHPMDKYIYQQNEVILCARDTDVFDLMLKSKVVITDYSSLIFDYSILCKPLILFMPDLHEFSKKIGGFYFGFPDAPDFDWVEKCYSELELISALRSIILDEGKLPNHSFIHKYNNFNATEFLIKGKHNV